MGGKQLRILVVAWFQPLLECFYVGSDWVGSRRNFPGYLATVPSGTLQYLYLHLSKI